MHTALLLRGRIAHLQLKEERAGKTEVAGDNNDTASGMDCASSSSVVWLAMLSGEAHTLETHVLPALESVAEALWGAVSKLLLMAEAVAAPFCVEYVVPAVHVETWTSNMPFLRGARISYGATFWATSVLGVVHDARCLCVPAQEGKARGLGEGRIGGLSSTAAGGIRRVGETPVAMMRVNREVAAAARRCVLGVLVQSVSVLQLCYALVEPSRGRMGQYKTDIFAVVAVVLMVLREIGEWGCGSGDREAGGEGRNGACRIRCGSCDGRAGREGGDGESGGDIIGTAVETEVARARALLAVGGGGGDGDGDGEHTDGRGARSASPRGVEWEEEEATRQELLQRCSSMMSTCALVAGDPNAVVRWLESKESPGAGGAGGAGARGGGGGGGGGAAAGEDAR